LHLNWVPLQIALVLALVLFPTANQAVPLGLGGKLAVALNAPKQYRQAILEELIIEAGRGAERGPQASNYTSELLNRPCVPILGIAAAREKVPVKTNNKTHKQADSNLEELHIWLIVPVVAVGVLIGFAGREWLVEHNKHIDTRVAGSCPPCDIERGTLSTDKPDHKP
jgi:hypothetical protein